MMGRGGLSLKAMFLIPGFLLLGCSSADYDDAQLGSSSKPADGVTMEVTSRSDDDYDVTLFFEDGATVDAVLAEREVYVGSRVIIYFGMDFEQEVALGRRVRPTAGMVEYILLHSSSGEPGGALRADETTGDSNRSVPNRPGATTLIPRGIRGIIY